MEKRCYNCAHFSLHYAKSPNATLISVNCGHCLANRRENHITPYKPACASWEEKVYPNKQLEDTIMNTLSRIKKYLHDIAFILEEEHNNKSDI